MLRETLEVAHTGLNEVIVSISSQLQVQQCHIGSLKLAIMAVFTTWKSENATNQGFLWAKKFKKTNNCLQKFLCTGFILLPVLWLALHSQALSLVLLLKRAFCCWFGLNIRNLYHSPKCSFNALTVYSTNS